MSGHCQGCGEYHEEDDDRKCAACAMTSDRLNDRLELAERLCGLRRRWFELTRQLGASTDRSDDDRMVRELESIEVEMRSAVVDVAKMLRSDDKEITQLRARAHQYQLAHEGSEAVIHMAIARMGGLVEGRPTHRGNFLQRIDELVAMENRIVGMLDEEARP